jgi:hypothetical protein
MVAGSGRWGENFGGRWTQAWIFVWSLNAFVASSSFLFVFYYEDISCMIFIIQVDLDSRCGKILIGCFIKSHVRRRSWIWRLKHLTRRVRKILIGWEIILS